MVTPPRNRGREVGQVHEATRKTTNHQGHEVSRRLVFRVPFVTFVFKRPCTLTYSFIC